MRYYVTADVHGYFTELKTALAEKGYFEDTGPRKLIVCGDLYDRGSEARQLQSFILDLLEKDEVILIRGNHEDLTMQLLYGWHQGSYFQLHHHTNRTIDTVLQLTGADPNWLYTNPEQIGRDLLHDPYIRTIIPAMVDYYETDHYIFTHGWIPCLPAEERPKEYVGVVDWRNADGKLWDKARWINGMEAAHCGVLEPGKTIVCGHWHCSFGHARYEHDGGEFDNNPNFDPYYGEGIIALDACTPRSGKVNCIVIED